MAGPGMMNAAHKNKTAITVISKIAERCGTGEACLIVIYGEELGRKYNLSQSEMLIGRSARCDVQIDQEAISRQHAKLEPNFGNIVLSDLGSTNGTYVNNDLIDQVPLNDGDLIKIGRTIFKYLSGNNIESQYHEEIHRLTTIDGLTQVYNKRYFMEQLEREISRARRYKRPFSLALFEVDAIEEVNRGYGHLAGDAVLAQLAKVANQDSRRHDVLARLGGERFGVVLPEVDLRGSRIYAERLRKVINGAQFTFEDVSIKVTASLGVASLDEDLDSQGLLNLATENLSLAQHRGGNCVNG